MSDKREVREGPAKSLEEQVPHEGEWVGYLSAQFPLSPSLQPMVAASRGLLGWNWPDRTVSFLEKGPDLSMVSCLRPKETPLDKGLFYVCSTSPFNTFFPSPPI
jgi:hypothetical protein